MSTEANENIHDVYYFQTCLISQDFSILVRMYYLTSKEKAVV